MNPTLLTDQIPQPDPWATPPDDFRFVLFERIDVEQNEQRYYLVAWQPTLFGWSVARDPGTYSRPTKAWVSDGAGGLVMPVQVVRRDSIQKVKAAEAAKPAHSRRVGPRWREFVKAADPPTRNYAKVLCDAPRNITRGFLEPTLDLWRSRGFPTSCDDLFA